MSEQRQNVPGPDPTVITTENIDREVGHLRELIESRLEGLDTRLNERDRRYTERFDAQQLAVKDAFDRAKGEVAAAFDSSEKAILKAEVSIEKRADATYVSLQELSRSQSSLMPRSEAEARFNSLTEKVDSATRKVENLETSKTAVSENKTDQRLTVGMMVGLISVVVSIIVVVNVLIAALA